jgi:hypothetical protein
MTDVQNEAPPTAWMSSDGRVRAFTAGDRTVTIQALDPCNRRIAWGELSIDDVAHLVDFLATIDTSDRPHPRTDSMEPKSLIALAREIATEAHAGQVDMPGHDYITHPLRVAERVAAAFPEAPAGVIAAALLHDVVEDTGSSDVDLVAAGIPRDVVDAVLAVTKRDHEPAELYFARVRANAWAVMVKTADIADNTDPDRVAQLDQLTRERLELKYSRARALLAGDTGL